MRARACQRRRSVARGTVRADRPARSGICRRRAHEWQRARRDAIGTSPSPLTAPAHPMGARTCPAFAGDADVLDASRHLPKRERSTAQVHEARRAASDDTADGRGNAFEREAEVAGRAEVSEGARDASGAQASAARGTTSGARVAATAGGGRATMSAIRRLPRRRRRAVVARPLRRALADVVILCSYILHTS
ncbi:uncharacterized protein SCHCODRAFT_02581626 [Schizophyllum commune H4-8]|uniref:uncharacterized protein n=1 Tax=Schizophyllum commune (strain H4-8 / FGSC 9210) TaxID=578458 RepID=UPI00215EFB1A|nr:uncharacterized protein SCHCODRAFT_02581626 [Schizophyllum commune H4-8]KAI5891651.1 hypothetical protein SCHCODRAFT_02581626 [Schizophyllum commune H4-8]